MTSPPDDTPAGLDLVGHTVTRVIDGVAYSQHYGPDHVVEGSMHVIDLPPGVAVFAVRHYAPA